MDKLKKDKGPRILLWDIETSPVLAWVWGTGEQFISHEQFLNDMRVDIICIAYKWLGSKTTHVLDWGQEQDSTQLVEKFTKVIESADVAIAYNGDGFDIKHLNTQRLLNGQPPISFPISEDPLKQMRKHFKFHSNKLDYVAKLLTGKGKSPMTFMDWKNIVWFKCPKALAKMKRYCKRDVQVMEEVFKKVEPFITPKASRATLKGIEGLACKHCGSAHLNKVGRYVNKTSVNQRFKCQSCGGTSMATIKKDGTYGSIK